MFDASELTPVLDAKFPELPPHLRQKLADGLVEFARDVATQVFEECAKIAEDPDNRVHGDADGTSRLIAISIRRQLEG